MKSFNISPKNRGGQIPELEGRPDKAFCGYCRLFADTELFLCDDGTIAIDVLLDKIVKEATTLTYKSFKSASCGIIFVI